MANPWERAWAVEDEEAKPWTRSWEVDAPDRKPAGFFSELGSAVSEGAQKTYRSARAALSTYLGAGEDVVEQSARTQEIERDSRATGLTQLKRDVQARKVADDDSLWSGIKNVAGAIIDNPRGGAQLVAEQAPNAAVALGTGFAGAKGGALIGSAFGPVGTAVGGTVGFITGLFGANTLLETGGKAIEAGQDKQFTPAERERVMREGAVKGAVITGVDAVTLGASKYVLGAANRAVEQATVRTLSDAGIDAQKAAQAIQQAQRDALQAGRGLSREALQESVEKATVEAMARQGLLKPDLVSAVQSAQKAAFDTSTTLAKRTGRGATALGLESFGEGLGEYTGELAATGEASFTDAALESVAGLATSLPELYVAKRLDQPGILTQEMSRSRPLDQASPPAPPSALQDLGTANTELSSAVDSYLRDLGQARTADEAINAAVSAASVPVAPTLPPLPTMDERLAAAESPGLLGRQLDIQRQLDQAAGLDVAPTAERPALPTLPPLPQPAAQRNMELMGQAAQAGTEFERQQALEQAKVSLPTPAPGPAARYADLTPMDARQAQQRLTVLQEQTGTPLSLEIVPHPAQKERFAIGRRELPVSAADLEMPDLRAPVAPAQAQVQIESAALAGKEVQRRAEDAPRQQMISRAMANIEARGGVASPYEAELLRSANLGQPYNSIDPNLGRPASQDQLLTAATGIPVGSEAGLGYGARTDNALTDIAQQTAQQRGELVQRNPQAAGQNIFSRVSDQDVQQRIPLERNRTPDDVSTGFAYTPELQGRKRAEPAEQAAPQADIVGTFVQQMRETNTPAARAFVQDYEAGRISPAEVQSALDIQRGLPPSSQERIEGAAAAAPAPATPTGVQVETPSARVENPALREAVELYGNRPLTQQDLTVEGATARIARAGQQAPAPQVTASGIEIAQSEDLTPRGAFRGRNEAIRAGNNLPRPTMVGGRRAASLTDADLQQTANDMGLPAITRRGAQIELLARQQTERAAAPAQPPADDVSARLQAAAAQATKPLDQPAPGRIITSGVKMSTARAAVPGSTLTVNDQGTDHQLRVVDSSTLGEPGKMIQQVARIFGKKVVVFESDTAQVDGFVRDDDDSTIYLSSKSSVSPLAVFGHELTHLIKRDSPEAYSALEAVVKANLKPEGMAGFEQDYGQGANLEELSSDLVGNRFQEADFWNGVFEDIAAKNPEQARGIITRLAASVNKAVNAFMRVVRGQTFNADQYVKDLTAVKAAVRTAVTQYAQQRREPAMRLDAELMRQESQVDLTAGSRVPASASVAGETAEPITASPVRPAVPEETEISTQNPQAVNRLYDPINDMLSIDEAAVREAMALPVKSGKTPLAESITNAILGYGFVPRDTPRDKVIEVYKQSIVSNLMYLFGKVPRNIRERSKLWYDGANRIATDMGKAYGVKMEQVAGIMAAMSPQKDWFQNVSMAERALDILTGQGQKAWDDNMLAYAKSYVEETRDRKEREKRQKAYDRAEQVAKAGTVLDDMSPEDAAVFIRSYDEAYHSRQYRIVTPEGGFGDLVRNADGTPSTMMWSTYDPIVKSVSIFRDGSRKNISEQLGEEHKIRSFYNNIAAPNSPISHVTIDTHAVAAGHFEALAGTDKEVTDNFGGTGGSSLLGVGGTYGIVADAYREAARLAGVSAREMQSITWEAVRGLFGENIKSSIKPKVREVWSQFRDGKLSFAAARRAIVKIAEGYNKVKGGIIDPDWVGSGPGQFVADGGTSYDKSFVPEGGVRLREAKELREKVTVNVSAATSSIPGLKELYARAMSGEAEAGQLLQQVAESSLRFLLGGTKARLVVAPSTGVYMSDREPSISIQVAFDESESKPVLAALATFADSYNQQQIHVRAPTAQPVGHDFGDGSYATPVYEIDLQRELSADDISAIIADTGLLGFTVTPKTLTAYWVRPTEEATDVDSYKAFKARIARVQELAGERGGRPKYRVERLYAYGEGDGAGIPYSAIRGDVRTKADADTETPRLIAEYLNKGPIKTFAQKPLTAAQVKEQKQLAQVFEALPTNDLARPVVQQAYSALTTALKEQFQVLPIKVEVMASVEVDGKAYPYWGPKSQTLVGKLVDDGMRPTRLGGPCSISSATTARRQRVGARDPLPRSRRWTESLTRTAPQCDATSASTTGSASTRHRRPRLALQVATSPATPCSRTPA